MYLLYSRPYNIGAAAAAGCVNDIISPHIIPFTFSKAEKRAKKELPALALQRKKKEIRLH